MAAAKLQSRSAGKKFLWSAADAYLFDIDGTLLNSLDGVHYTAFLNALRGVFGVASALDGILVHGNTDVGILRAAVERAGVTAPVFEERLPRAIAQMCAEVARNASALRSEVCPSVRPLLQRLRDRRKLLAVVSGNLEPIGWLKLEACGLRPFFAFGSFSHPRERRADIFQHGIEEARRRLGAGARVCVLGDTPADIESAQRLGAAVVAVATGIYSQNELAACGPDLCVPCCSELLKRPVIPNRK